MIIIYPMLVSSSLNQEILPGVAKVLEKYILVYKRDEIIEEMKREISSANVKKGRFQIKENLDYSKFHILSEQEHSGQGELEPGTKHTQDKEPDDKKGEEVESDITGLERDIEDEPYAKRDLSKRIKELDKKISEIDSEIKKIRQKFFNDEVEPEDKKELRQKLSDLKRKKSELQKRREYLSDKLQGLEQKEKQSKNASVKISAESDAVSIEPTWMYVDRYKDGQNYTDLVGVKVVPYVVQSDSELANLLLFDKNLKKIDQHIIKAGRTIKKYMFSAWKHALSRIPVLKHIASGRKNIQGKVEPDILLAKSKYKENVFACVNRMDLSDDFFQSAGGISKLFKMGWSSIISLDDVKQTGYFCMKEFKGMCYTIPYQYLLASVGGQYKQVYDDLNDVKKATSSFFRQKTSMKSLVSESYTDYQLNKISPEARIASVCEQAILSEDFKFKKKALEGTRKLKDLIGILNSKEIDNSYKKLSSQTNIKSIAEAKKEASKINPNFRKAYNLAKKKFSSKFKDIDNRILEILACMVGLYSIRDLSAGMSRLEYTDKMVDNTINKMEKKYKKINSKFDLEKIDSTYILGIIAVGSISLLGIKVLLWAIYAFVWMFSTDRYQPQADPDVPQSIGPTTDVPFGVGTRTGTPEDPETLQAIGSTISGTFTVIFNIVYYLIWFAWEVLMFLIQPLIDAGELTLEVVKEIFFVVLPIKSLARTVGSLNPLEGISSILDLLSF